MGCVRKEYFSKPRRLKSEKYPLEDGEYVVIQELTSRELVEIQNTYGKEESTSNLAFVYDYLSRVLVDDAGVRLFADAADVEAHFNMSIPALENLTEFALEVSGINTTRVDDAKN
jgi:hypothetical protein